VTEPAPRPVLPDTEPAPLDEGARSRTAVESDLAPWSDSDVQLVAGPAVAFAKNSAPPPDEQMPTVGHIGRYALKYPIGEGGLGTVYAAHDPLLSRLIAIKTLNLELDENERESFNQLFLNEARAAAGLSHPHIVTVHDAGVSDQGAYIAMELLKGRDLRLLRQEGWRPTPMQAALIVRRVADALAYAHSKGVIHLDIKPANIFMVGRTQPKVLDFGIARIAHRHDSFRFDGSSSGDVVAGSPHYMAPEQIRLQAVDRRTDVFALGVVLYELLTDQKPFVGQTLSDITRAVLEVEPPLASTVDPTIPRPLAEIAQRAMHKDPDARYRSTRSFARDLRHWLDEHAQATEPAEEPAPKAPPPRSSGLLWWAAVAGLAVTVSTVMWTTLGSRGESGTAARSEPRQGLVAGGLVQNAPTAPATGDAPRSAPADGSAPPGPSGAAPAPAAVPAAAPSAPGVVPPPADLRPTEDARVAAAPGAAPAARMGVEPPSAPAAAPAALPPTGAGPVPGPASPAAAARAAGAPSRDPRTAEPRPRPAREVPRATAAAGTAPTATAGATLGEVRIAVSPWGDVEVDGAPKGTTPPLSVLRLPEGRHQIVIRNADFPPYATTVVVRPGEPVTVRHRFGS
jgi:eukaryotic-like serine/threonine-protein kinase